MASYHDQLKALAESIGSDGCTNALDICIECCWEHDYTYITGMTPRGRVVTKEYADRRFRDCYQAHLSLRWYSPISWVYYLGVMKFGKGIWGKKLVTKKQYIFLDYKLLEEAEQVRIKIIESCQQN